MNEATSSAAALEASVPIAVLDACVLAPAVSRALLLGAARAGLFEPRWTTRIEGEWAAAMAKRPDAPPEAVLAGEIALARAAFPQVLVRGWEAEEARVSLPDWNDRHVLAAAIVADATLIVTDNLKDFPRRALAGHGLAREPADALLWRLCGEAPDVMRGVLVAFADELGVEMGEDLRRALKRARLPRLGKAVLTL